MIPNDLVPDLATDPVPGRRRRHTRPIAAVAAAIALVTGACTSDDTDGSDSGDVSIEDIGTADATEPDTTAGSGFAIELERAGHEAVACLAPEKDVLAKLPPELRSTPALTAIAFVNDFEWIRQAFERAAGTPVEHRLIHYKVRKPE